MRFAADLHLHSRFASGVSPAMTLENIALWAQRKGVDLLGTGDCLQPQWLDELEANLIEAEPGFYVLQPELERLIHARLPERLRRSLRFVLSTEVNCVESVEREMSGIHQLIYFPSFAVAREFAARISRKGDLQEGRPTLVLSPRDLVRGARGFDRVHVAAPHVMNPWFSVLGVVGGDISAEKIYRDQLDHLWAVETGLTSNPAMCRRVSSLDGLGLFSCSDAHSLENIGREYTLLDIEPGYESLMRAIRGGTSTHGVLQTCKFPIRSTRYFLNWCSACQQPFDAWPMCPVCRRRLTMGSRDRLEIIAQDRPEPVSPPAAPPFKEWRPLAFIIADVEGRKPESASVRRIAGEMVDQLGHERDILTKVPLDDLLRVTSPEIAGEIINRRENSTSRDLGQSGFEF